MSDEHRISDRDFKRLVDTIGDDLEARMKKILETQFELLGINIRTPESREVFREKMSFISGLKLGAETMRRGAGKRILDLLFGAIATALAAVLGLSMWGGKPPLH